MNSDFTSGWNEIIRLSEQTQRVYLIYYWYATLVIGNVLLWSIYLEAYSISTCIVVTITRANIDATLNDKSTCLVVWLFIAFPSNIAVVNF